MSNLKFRAYINGKEQYPELTISYRADPIKDEVKEMFDQFTYYEEREYLFDDILDSSGRMKRSDTCMTLVDGSFVHQKSKGGTFYKKQGAVVTAHALLKTGNFSAREVQKICNVSWKITKKILAADPTLKCAFGEPLKGHKPHCKHRLNKPK